MSRLIDADALWMDVIHAMDYCDDILEIIEQQPTVEPERRTGKWEYHSNGKSLVYTMNPEDAYCSACGFHVYTPETENFDDYNFCPHCGAKMKGESDE